MRSIIYKIHPSRCHEIENFRAEISGLPEHISIFDLRHGKGFDDLADHQLIGAFSTIPETIKKVVLEEGAFSERAEKVNILAAIPRRVAVEYKSSNNPGPALFDQPIAPHAVENPEASGSNLKPK